MLKEELYEAYIRIMHEELVPAMGCTEPIAIAYAASKAREVLDCLPERVAVRVSGNILKNVKSVIVPNTGGQRGVKAAAAAGIVAGDSSKKLEVISSVPLETQRLITKYLQQAEFEVSVSDSSHILDICIVVSAGAEQASVRIVDNHTNIVQITKNDSVLFQKETEDSEEDSLQDKSVLSVRDIVEFADTVDLSRVKELLDRQIRLNSAIAEEGLTGKWGAAIGKILLSQKPGDIVTEARAYAAAGSDARMSGCDMPVVILSGSGNQGITASLPVIRYAKHLRSTEEQLYRALIVSVLTTVHQKTGIGRLSAYCGAVSAGCGAGAGIAYLHGADYVGIAHTLVNAVAILSGTVCDGAKPSCAAKINEAVSAGILGWHMYQQHREFTDGEGLVLKGVDRTITNIGKLAKEGMHTTDEVIIKLMLKSC